MTLLAFQTQATQLVSKDILMGEMNISRAHISSLQLAYNTTLSTCSPTGAACVLIHSGSTKRKWSVEDQVNVGGGCDDSKSGSVGAGSTHGSPTLIPRTSTNESR